ncbi:NAD(P)H-dependent oxidoreductase [Kutzneria sp. NPDC052558]|uniref:NAD(P)H-dependent oxidoreductase n=1 Tax=Kutzneria sp. NPDC052558 TaxID=3364121 RepID=UPI0037CAEE67
MTDRPKALWVYAHPTEHSLNADLFKLGTEALSGTHTVRTSDLYAQGWDPRLSLRDVGDFADPATTFGEQTREAALAGGLPADVRAEQAKLAEADLLVLQFPLWWYGMPAMLKGWFDRVFTNGFAYGVRDPETGDTLKYGDGGLAGRRALVITTAGDRPSSFTPRGLNGDLESLLFPLLHGTLWYTGIAPLRPHLLGGTDYPSWRGYTEEIGRLRARLATVAEESPIPYRRLRDGDYDADNVLRRDILPGRHDLGVHQHR